MKPLETFTIHIQEHMASRFGIFHDTKYYDAYMTDIIKRARMINSKALIRHLKVHPCVAQKVALGSVSCTVTLSLSGRFLSTSITSR